MKKLFLFVVLFHAVVFAGSFDGKTFDYYSPLYSSSGSSPTVPNRNLVLSSDGVTSSDALFIVLSNPCAISFDGSGLLYPSFDDLSSLVSNSTKSAYYPFKCHQDNLYYGFLDVVPQVNSLFTFAARLYRSGFLSTSFTDVHSNSSGSIVYANLNFSAFVSDVLSSTNLFWKSELFRNLSSISFALSSIGSSVINIENSISGLSSSSDELSPGAFSNYVYTINRNVILDGDIQIDFSSIADSIDPNRFRDTPEARAMRDFTFDQYRRGLSLAQALAGLAAVVGDVNVNSGLSSLGGAFNFSLRKDLDVGVASLSNSLSSVSSHVDGVGSSLSNSLSSVSSHIDGVGSSLGNALAGVNSSLDSGFSNLVSVSSFGPDSALAALFSGDPSRIGEIHTDPNDPLNPNNPHSILNPNNPSFIGGGGGIHGAFTTNNVVKPLSNAVDHAEASITSNIVDGAKSVSSNVVDSAIMLKDILDKINEILKNLTTPDSGDSIAASVRIVGPLDNGRVAVDLPWGPGDLFDVDVFSNIIVDAFSSFNPDFVVTNTSPDYTPYLEQLISNTAPYRLWTDYESLMNGDWSSVSSAALEDSFKDTISDFDLIGKDFWHYFTYVSGRQACDVHSLANIFTNLLPLVDFINSQDFGTDDQGNSKSMFDIGFDVISSYPSRSAIEDYISQVTNASNSVLSSTNAISRLASSTNTVHDILGRYFLDKGSSLPSSLVFLKLSSPDGGDSKDFEIPLSDRQELWSTLRASITVVFTLVNLILLPKFLLMVFRLFMRLFNRSLPFLGSKE